MGQKIKPRQQADASRHKKPRNLIIKDMNARGASNGGRMRHRSDRRPNDARRNRFDDDIE
jgi:hypothetical protein